MHAEACRRFNRFYPTGLIEPVAIAIVDLRKDRVRRFAVDTPYQGLVRVNGPVAYIDYRLKCIGECNVELVGGVATVAPRRDLGAGGTA